MIKIGEAAVLLGLTDSEKDKSRAREVLTFFGVRTETPEKVPGTFGAVSKLYDADQVKHIAQFRAGF